MRTHPKTGENYVGQAKSSRGPLANKRHQMSEPRYRAAGGKFPCLIELQKGTLKNGKTKTELAGRRLFWHSHRR